MHTSVGNCYLKITLLLSQGHKSYDNTVKKSACKGKDSVQSYNLRKQQKITQVMQLYAKLLDICLS